MQTMDSYIKNLDAAQAAALQQVRTIIHKTVPQAEEGIAHTIPAFLYKGRPLIGFAAHADYLGIYTFRPDVITVFKDKLQAFELKSRVIQFTADKPVPQDVIEAIVLYLMHMVDAD
ncbi:MAG: iron chaperone [Candidatus Saccharibacteria bacterium]